MRVAFRVALGNVPDGLLRTRIRVLKLQSIDRYNPSKLIDKLQDVDEMRNAASDLGLRFPSMLHIEFLTLRTDGPRVPAVFSNVTALEVLDSLAKNFKGLVLYGICTKGPKPRPVFISFVSLG
jgi:hypothetical protein